MIIEMRNTADDAGADTTQNDTGKERRPIATRTVLTGSKRQFRRSMDLPAHHHAAERLPCE